MRRCFSVKQCCSPTFGALPVEVLQEFLAKANQYFENFRNAQDAILQAVETEDEHLIQAVFFIETDLVFAEVRARLNARIKTSNASSSSSMLLPIVVSAMPNAQQAVVTSITTDQGANRVPTAAITTSTRSGQTMPDATESVTRISSKQVGVRVTPIPMFDQKTLGTFDENAAHSPNFTGHAAMIIGMGAPSIERFERAWTRLCQFYDDPEARRQALINELHPLRPTNHPPAAAITKLHQLLQYVLEQFHILRIEMGAWATVLLHGVTAALHSRECKMKKIVFPL